MSRQRQPLPLGDAPEHEAAKMLGLKPDAFRSMLPQLQRRGFPLADPDTKLFDLDAIAEWRRRRHPQLFTGTTGSGLTPPASQGDVSRRTKERLEALSRGDRENPVLCP